MLHGTQAFKEFLLLGLTCIRSHIRTVRVGGRWVVKRKCLACSHGGREGPEEEGQKWGTLLRKGTRWKVKKIKDVGKHA